MKRFAFILFQKIAIWILKKTKYEFTIQHDDIKVEAQEVGMKGITTRYDFVCTHKGNANEFLNYIPSKRYFETEEIFDCPNPKVKGVMFKEENQARNLEMQYNKLISRVANSAKVVL